MNVDAYTRIVKVASLLKKLRGKPVPNAPTGMPAPQPNEDKTVDGAYDSENTGDPGIQHGVTGTGNGPIIGIG